jgi:hypothetical protein
MANPDPTDFIAAETNRIPFGRSSSAVSDWVGSFKYWPSTIAGWSVGPVWHRPLPQSFFRKPFV